MSTSRAKAAAAIEQHLGLVSSQEHPARSLTEEEERQARIARRKALFEEIHASPMIEVPDDFPSSAEIIRELRDSR